LLKLVWLVVEQSAGAVFGCTSQFFYRPDQMGLLIDDCGMIFAHLAKNTLKQPKA
jgi:hypothetical protein